MRRWWFLLSWLALAACGHGEGAPTASASAEAAPALSVVPVAVVLPSGETVIDGALLARARPDFVDGEHRGWWLRSLVPSFDPKAAVDIEDADGRVTPIEPAAEPGPPRELLVALSKQGELKVTLAAPDDPFPAFHGRGGNRGRGPDPARIQRVRRIIVKSATPSPR